jgi:DNA-binding NarL/FixJ family response regulator
VNEPVRVLLLEVPQLLRGILEHAIQLQNGCELVKDTRRALQMLKDQGAAPDIVVLGLSAAEDATLVPALFARWPSAQVITVMQSGEEANVYQLEPHARTLPQPSPGEIVERLRMAVDQSRRAAQR